jgi:hypothetical protein
MSALSIQRNKLPLGFLAVAALFYLIDGAIVHSSLFARQPELLSAVASFDLTLGVTLAYWLMVVRPGKAAVRSLLPVFIASIVAAAITLPAGHRDLLQYLRYAAIPLELAVFGLVFVGVRSANRRLHAAGTQLDVPERIAAALTNGGVASHIAHVVATEMSIFWYALASWRRKPFVPDGARGFSYHRKNGYAGILYTLARMSLVEMIAIDFLIRVKHPHAANVVLAVDLFAAVWLLGFARAVQLRPILLSADKLFVRMGLQWSVEIDRVNIESVRVGRANLPAKGTPSYMRIAPQPNSLITLKEPVVARGVYGMTKSVRQIGVAFDDLKGFEAAVRLGTA